MKKIIPQILKSMLFAGFLCCIFISEVAAQQQTHRYLKEIINNNNIVQYEMYYPEYWAAASTLSDAKLTDRLAAKNGFISVTRNTNNQTFLITFEKSKAVNLVTKEIFDFNNREIIPLVP